MVGFIKNDTLTANQKFIAGCVTGVVTRFITQPLDVIKVKTQLQKRSKMRKGRTWVRYIRMIVKEEGITALWTGHNLGQIHSILAVTSQFFVYEMSTKYVEKNFGDRSIKPVLTMMCGVLGGCCSATLATPLEVIRVRQMLVKSQYKGIINGARGVYKTGGFFGLYEGLSANLMQMGPQVGIAFSVFSVTQPILIRYFGRCVGPDCETTDHMPRPEALLYASTLSASLAGLISKTLTYPFDLAKRRMQIASHKTDARYHIPRSSKNVIKCKKLVECLRMAFKKEGVLGLYRGWVVTMYKTQMTSIVSFTTYELMCHAFRQMN